MDRRNRSAGAGADPTEAIQWEPLTAEGSAAAGRDQARRPIGLCIASVEGTLAGYIIQELSHELPPSAGEVEAAAAVTSFCCVPPSSCRISVQAWISLR
jgi:hypothetical protein